MSKGLIILYVAQVPSCLFSNVLKWVEGFELQVRWCVTTKIPHFKIYPNTVWLPQFPHCHVSLWPVPALLSLLPLPFHLCVPNEGLCDAGQGCKGDSSGLGQIISVLCHGQCLSKGDRKKGLSLCASPIQWQEPSTGHCNEIWGIMGEPVPGPIDASAKAAFNLLWVGLDC